MNTVTTSRGLNQLYFNSNIIYLYKDAISTATSPPCWTNNRAASLSLNSLTGRIKIFSYSEMIFFKKPGVIFQMKWVGAEQGKEEDFPEWSNQDSESFKV